jgi:subtilisin family serine protease
MVATARRIRPSRLALAALAALTLAAPAWSGAVPGLRVMLHPHAATRGTLPEAMHAKLERIAGTTLTLTGTTRTGALELATPGPLDDATAARLAMALRVDREVLWAEPQRAARPTPKASSRDARYNRLGRELMVRLADGVAEDWSTLAPRFAERIGMPIAAERKVGNVWKLSVAIARTPDALAALAKALEQDGAVMYADPVRYMYPQFTPNDPLFALQWSLTDAVAGINAGSAWDLQRGSSGLAIAVIDTGILDHPDLAGRVLPGYDFVTDAARARDGDARDANPRDEGDWASAGDCGDGVPAFDSFFHGLFVAGLIAANPDNGIGIAGLDFNAKILPVRALARCGGTDADIFEGMLWASGVPIAGIPPNPNPARIINLSLGGFGACSAAIQEAVDDAIAQGSIVVVSAGNESSDALDFAPSNCSGVVTVGASNVVGDRTGYSNYGTRVDISAPGGDGSDETTLIVSTGNDGLTVPGAPAYMIAAGTSFSAPLVTGTVALMLARNNTLTSGRVLSILQGTSREFPFGTSCRAGSVCGSGLLDAGLAVASTIPATQNIPPNAVPIIEYYRGDTDHYFITADVNEVAYIDTFLRGTYQRTGIVFFGYLDAFLAPPGVMPVCRFYAGGGIDSHFFTASPAECQFVQQRWSGTWFLESPAAFYIEVPDGTGACRAGTIPIYRFFDNRQDANHRHTPDLSVKRAMINRGWIPEGINGVAFCSPI